MPSPSSKKKSRRNRNKRNKNKNKSKKSNTTTTKDAPKKLTHHDDGTAPTKDIFEIGTVVYITGLTKLTKLNGQLGVILRYVKEKGRYEVILSRGSRKTSTWSLHPDNLVLSVNENCGGDTMKKFGPIVSPTCQNDTILLPTQKEFTTQRIFQHVAFWPSHDETSTIGHSAVHAFDDWPTTKEDGFHPHDWINVASFLRNRLKWERPTILRGVISAESTKPNFILYFDSDDKESPANETAMLIRDLMPVHEVRQLPLCYHEPIRGVCVLVYTPSPPPPPPKPITPSLRHPYQDDHRAIGQRFSHCGVESNLVVPLRAICLGAIHGAGYQSHNFVFVVFPVKIQSSCFSRFIPFLLFEKVQQNQEKE